MSKGGRPPKDYKVAKNGNSFVCWYRNQYIGSASAKDLCLLLAEALDVKIQFDKKTICDNIGTDSKSTKSDSDVSLPG